MGKVTQTYWNKVDRKIASNDFKQVFCESTCDGEREDGERREEGRGREDEERREEGRGGRRGEEGGGERREEGRGRGRWGEGGRRERKGG